LRILLVRLRLIGDVVFTTPLVGALRRRYPDARLSYLVEPAAAPIVTASPHLDDVIVLPRRRGLARLADDVRAARRLRAERFDVAIDLHGGPRAAWLTRATGAPMRIGYTITGRTWMYTHVVPRAPELAARHSVANQWDLLTPLGFSEPDRAQQPVEMAPDRAAAARIDARLAAGGIGPDAPLIVVHVSASNRFRRWPAESFVRVITELARQDPRRRIVVFSGPTDREAADRVVESARAHLGPLAAAVPDFGPTDLPELRALVARAAVYIGGDTGPMHIATTTATPIVAIIGPTLGQRSSPWRDPALFSAVLEPGPLPCRPCQQRQCEPGDFRCLTSIGPERVIDAAERAMRAS
jgi:lipopolysaccharide heptosyltransferase II